MHFPPTDVAEQPADVRLLEVTKRFDDVVAVDDLSLAIPRGSFFALLGPSGCGKTTTLRMIGGFEDPTVGRIQLGDVDVTGLPPYKRDVNTVFQSYALFPHLTVFENVAFGLRRKREREIPRRVSEMLGIVGLEGMEQRRPRQLSGGQQQRVALARALVNHPRVLLLDEPLGALDLKLRKQMQLELKRIQSEVGITFVHVTHDQEEAMTMADQIAIMDGGRIQQLGPPEELYERPRTAFVAGFLGISNLLAADTVGATRVRLTDGTELQVSLDGRSGRVAVGIRPEKISLDAPGASISETQSPENALRGRIVERAYVGVTTQYVIDTAAGRVSAVVQNSSPRSSSLGPGDSVTAGWSPEATFVVDLPQEET